MAAVHDLHHAKLPSLIGLAHAQLWVTNSLHIAPFAVAWAYARLKPTNTSSPRASPDIEPLKMTSMAEVKAALAKAVKAEDYAKAAALQHQLKEMEARSEARDQKAPNAADSDGGHSEGGYD